jgi:hypothetical protein
VRLVCMCVCVCVCVCVCDMAHTCSYCRFRGGVHIRAGSGQYITCAFSFCIYFYYIRYSKHKFFLSHRILKIIEMYYSFYCISIGILIVNISIYQFWKISSRCSSACCSSRGSHTRFYYFIYFNNCKNK